MSGGEFKNKTTKALSQIKKKQKLLAVKRLGLRDYEEAWKDIKKALKNTRPHFRSWEEAIRRT